MIHPGKPNVSKADIREKLAEMYKCGTDVRVVLRRACIVLAVCIVAALAHLHKPTHARAHTRTHICTHVHTCLSCAHGERSGPKR